MFTLPENLESMHSQEEQLRNRALVLVAEDRKLALNMEVIERAMDLSNSLRQFPTSDEDLKVIQILGMRMFNAFGASLKLALSGYVQNSALIMRDILETVFLVDLFRADRTFIAKWRFANKETLRNEFSPVAIRKALDAHYGHTTRRREELYKLFSELAAHPTMKSAWMMRPQPDGEAVIGPYIEKTSLEAVLSEMGRLAVQSGQHLSAFFPAGWQNGHRPRLAFAQVTKVWLEAFYPGASKS
jgi:hypothetical protein